MGGAHASNAIDNSVSAMINVANDTGQTCQPISVQVQDIDFSACGGNINISNTTFGQISTMDVSCTQQAAQKAYSKTSLDQKAQQMAKSLTTGLSLNPGSSDASNIMQLSMSVGEAIHNSAQQLIASATNQAQNLSFTTKCNAQGGGDINVNDVQFTQFSSSIVKGLQKSKQVATAVTALKQAASQTASAKQTGIFGDFNVFAIVAVVIALAVLGPLLRPAQTKVGRAVKLALVAGLLGLAAYAYTLFKSSGDSPMDWAKSMTHTA